MADPRDARFAVPRLYPILNVAQEDSAAIAQARRLAAAVAGAGASILQLRAKTLPAGPLAELAADLVDDLRRYDCRLIVNDRADIAASVGAAGVHLGDEDLDPRDARALLGPDAIIGYSTHAPEEAAAAASLPVDYLGFGPVFDSPTKAGVRSPRGVARLAEACRAAGTRPVVAIGGVTLETAATALSAGAAAVAVIRDLELTADPAARVQQYLAL